MLTRKLLVVFVLLLPSLAHGEEISEGARQQLMVRPPVLLSGDGTVANAYGVPVTQRDVDLHAAFGFCEIRKGDATHQADVTFWPELAPGAPANPPPGPCSKIGQLYEQSGAKAKYDRAYANQRTQQFNAVMRATEVQ